VNVRPYYLLFTIHHSPSRDSIQHHHLSHRYSGSWQIRHRKRDRSIDGTEACNNQVINTPIYSPVGYDGTDAFQFPSSAWKQIESIQRAVLAVIRDCPPDESFIFTNCLEANVPTDLEWYKRVERVAKQRKAQFFPVWLTCDAKKIRERKAGADRKSRWKDTDLSNIDRCVNQFEVLKVDDPQGSHCRHL